MADLEEPAQPKPTVPEPSQQQTPEPPKHKPYKKAISIILIGMILASFGTLGHFYWNLNNKYNNLQSDYVTLQSIHNQLNIDYEDLEQDYCSLDAKYNEMNSEYQNLFADYDALSDVLNEPLENKKVPTVEELQQWLSDDKTDEIQYNYPDFICGDFSVMLSQHAKVMNWDMGIVLVYGHDENYATYSHAFNAIITAEGLRYVEPQDDYFWHFADGLPILEDRWNEIGRDRTNIYVEEYVEILNF